MMKNHNRFFRILPSKETSPKEVNAKQEIKRKLFKRRVSKGDRISLLAYRTMVNV
jgi:hypothetical protein